VVVKVFKKADFYVQLGVRALFGSKSERQVTKRLITCLSDLGIFRAFLGPKKCLKSPQIPWGRQVSLKVTLVTF